MRQTTCGTDAPYSRVNMLTQEPRLAVKPREPGDGMDRHKVFVYGTLKSGHGNHHILEHDRVIKFGAEIMMYPGHLVDLGAFPALLKTRTELNQINGELYEVPEEVFRRLDMLEGYPNFYNREQRVTKNRHEAWVYFVDNGYDNYPLVPRNDWRPNR